MNLGQLFEQKPVAGQQVADFMVGVGQDQRDRVEHVRGAQTVNQPLQQLRQGAGAQQLELALLRLAQQSVVATDFVGKLGQACLQRAHFDVQLCDPVSGRGIAFGRARMLNQARRSATLRRSSR